ASSFESLRMNGVEAPNEPRAEPLSIFAFRFSTSVAPMPVISLVDEPDSEELRELYERLSQNMPEIGVLNIFKVMAHNPQLLRGWLRMATPLLAGGLTLSPRLREIAILRVAQVCGSEYEFAHPIRIAQQAGLSEDEIASLQ